MGNVKLIFPDTERLIDFLLENEVSSVEVSNCTFKGPLTDEMVVNACTLYHALLVYPNLQVRSKDFSYLSSTEM